MKYVKKINNLLVARFISSGKASGKMRLCVVGLKNSALLEFTPGILMGWTHQMTHLSKTEADFPDYSQEEIAAFMEREWRLEKIEFSDEELLEVIKKYAGEVLE